MKNLHPIPRPWTSPWERPPAVAVLEDGLIMRGRGFGAEGSTVGEAVFSTGMSGYQETLTDPSYHRQVVVMTSPHVGNTGMNQRDRESSRIWAAGYIVRVPALRPSNWRSESTLEEDLRADGVVGICDIDTRKLTRHIRDQGAKRIGIFSGAEASRSEAELLAIVRASPKMAGCELASEVSVPETYIVSAQGQKRFTVAAIDLGIKSTTPELMSQRGIEVHVLPVTSTIEDVLALSPDGVFFSNGPGDPSTAPQVTLLREVLARRIPFFGICFGNQLLGRALGFGTYKLLYGHRGINQPVMDLATREVHITAHNHGFAVDAPIGEVVSAPINEQGADFGRVEVSHVCLNDQVVEGLRCVDIPAFSVQYHPEAAAGPHDAVDLFDQFTQMMDSQKAGMR